MRTISARAVTRLISDLCILSNTQLREDVLSRVKAASLKEKHRRAKDILKAIINNARIARKEALPICQDTGLPCVFVEIGQGLKIAGDLKAAIRRGVESGYRKGRLRNSLVKNPLKRGRPAYLPPIIHVDVVKGNRLKLTVLPKGFGCENKTQLKMFNPTVEIDRIKNFIIEVVKDAGPDACPPFIIGVGIGGSADYAVFMAKRALLRKLGSVNPEVRKLEKELLSKINKLNIGPMGLGGVTTALALNIDTYPTHIAGLPVAVNISCHALRSATARL